MLSKIFYKLGTKIIKSPVEKSDYLKVYINTQPGDRDSDTEAISDAVL